MIDFYKLVVFAQIASHFYRIVETDLSVDNTLNSTFFDSTWSPRDRHGPDQTIPSCGVGNITEPTCTSKVKKNYSAMDPCSLSGSCEFMASLEPAVARFCHCDSHCAKYGDCCHDSDFKLDETKKDIRYGCRRIRTGSVLQHVGIYVIDKCPSIYEGTEMEAKCQQRLGLSGPFVADKNGTVYKNRFCALCNNANNVTAFELELNNLKENQINRTINLEDMWSHTNVEYKMHPPGGVVVRSCAITDTPFGKNQACDLYNVNPIIYTRGDSRQTVLYRNYLCSAGENITFQKCYGTYIDDITLHHGVYPLSVMFSFSSKKSSSCWNIGDTCYEEPTIQNARIMVHLCLISDIQLDGTTLLNLLTSTIDVLGHVRILSVNAVMATKQSTRITYFVTLWLIIIRKVTVSELAILETQILKFTGKIHITLPESNQQKVMYMESLKEIPTGNFSGNWKYTYTRSTPDISDRYGIFFLQSMHMLNEFCPHILMNCSIVKHVLVIEHLICIPSDKETGNISAYTKIIITYVGCSLSVLSLLMSISLSRSLNMCNSVPGKNLENMSIAMSLSNLLFMLGVGLQDFQRLCYITGILLQYLWLSCFSFMSIAVVYIWRQVTSWTVSIGRTDIKPVTWPLSVTGLCIPLLFVVPAALLDFYDIPDFHADYAGAVCFPTGYLVNVLFFTCPVILSIVINLVAFVLIVLHISRHNKDMKILRKSVPTHHAKIYGRVCSFTGMFWISGIIGAFFRSDVVDYIFIVLCSFQGLGVAIANLTTKQFLSRLTNSTPKFSVTTSKSNIQSSD